MKANREKGSLLLETMISLAILGIVVISVVGSTANINKGWIQLEKLTDTYNTIYSTYQILRGLNSTSWLNSNLNKNILTEFKNKYGENTSFKFYFSNLSSIEVTGYDQKTFESNGKTIKYYTYYIINYKLINPNKTVKLPLTINYITPIKAGE